jgi:zinc transporter ZupT
LLPEPDLSRLLLAAERRDGDGRKVHIDQGSIPLLNSVLWSGLLTAVSLALHNFPGAFLDPPLPNLPLLTITSDGLTTYPTPLNRPPQTTTTITTNTTTEGIAVSVAATQGLRFSFPLTIAIACHNIPEGASVALPIYFSLRDKRKAILVSLLSGMAEPLGVLVLVSLGPAALSPRAIACLLSFVGGVMIALSCFELLPQAKALLSAPEALRATAFGFVIMAAILTSLHAFDAMM